MSIEAIPPFEARTSPLSFIYRRINISSSFSTAPHSPSKMLLSSFSAICSSIFSPGKTRARPERVCTALSYFSLSTCRPRTLSARPRGQSVQVKTHNAADRHHLTVVGATSGDTGSAAIYGLRGKNDVSVFIMYPKGRVSPIQELQMTTVPDANVYNLAISGTFDDCQVYWKHPFVFSKDVWPSLRFPHAHHLSLHFLI